MPKKAAVRVFCVWLGAVWEFLKLTGPCTMDPKLVRLLLSGSPKKGSPIYGNGHVVLMTISAESVPCINRRVEELETIAKHPIYRNTRTNSNPKGPGTQIQSTFPKPLLRFRIKKPYIPHIWVLWTLRVNFCYINPKFLLRSLQPLSKDPHPISGNSHTGPHENIWTSTVCRTIGRNL